MSGVGTDRHLRLISDDDERDLTDLGVRVPQPRGVPLPPTDHQRQHLIEGIAAQQGWAGTLDDRTVQRRALRHDCPRAACRAPATRQCRRRVRGSWRPKDRVCAERAALVAEVDPDQGASLSDPTPRVAVTPTR